MKIEKFYLSKRRLYHIIVSGSQKDCYSFFENILMSLTDIRRIAFEYNESGKAEILVKCTEPQKLETLVQQQ